MAAVFEAEVAQEIKQCFIICLVQIVTEMNNMMI